MTTEEYQALVLRTGLRQIDIAWMMGVTGRQSQRWWCGASPIPRSVELLLKGLAEGKLKPRWFRKRIKEPLPYSDATYR